MLKNKIYILKPFKIINKIKKYTLDVGFRVSHVYELKLKWFLLDLI